MPIHDWSHRPSSLFHHFHQQWSAEICKALNDGLLPDGYEALIEQKVKRPEPDVLALHSSRSLPDRPAGGAVTLAEPRTRFMSKSNADVYARKANLVTIRHLLGPVVAVIEIVSRGNKASRAAFGEFIDKSVGFIRNGVNLLVIDLFEPTSRDPQGIHAAIWQYFSDEEFLLPVDKKLTLATYRAGEHREAYIEPVAVGDTLPPIGIYLNSWEYVEVPLEVTYGLAWKYCPPSFRLAIETGEYANPEEFD